jgi:hypothetical protein
MSENQEKNKILQLASDLDKDLESQNIENVIRYFSEECEIELLDITLRGTSGLKKWLNWFFSLFDTITFDPITIMVKENIFFEEFFINVSFKDGKKMKSKMAEVLKYENYKIKSLRLYFDRLVFAEAAVDGFLSRKIVKLLKKKSLEGLI